MPTCKKPTETTLVAQCLQWLKIKGILAWRANAGGMIGESGGKRRFVRFGIPGQADITGIMSDGRRLEIECKMPRKKMTEAQCQFLHQISMHGGVAFMVSSVDELIAMMATLQDTDLFSGVESAPLQSP